VKPRSPHEFPFKDSYLIESLRVFFEAFMTEALAASLAAGLPQTKQRAIP
jgi:hypothetical protein